MTRHTNRSRASRAAALRPAPAAGTLLAGMLGAVFLPAQAHADEAAATGPDIVVNGQRQGDANPNADEAAPYKVERSADSRFTEDVRDTPKSIAIIPKEVIEDVGATSFRDLARTTPGVTLGTGEGGNAFGDRIFIRGFEARNDIYIDGQRDPGVSSREIFAVEQVEIVKGPSSAYLGRGTTGGSVGLQSKRAQTGNDFVVAEGTVGTDNLWRGTVDANAELTEGLALRVNALYHTGDVPGRDYVDSERYGVAAALGWQASDTFSAGLDYYHYRSDGMSDYGHPFDPVTQEPYAVDPDNFYGAVGRDFIQNDADIGTLALEWQPIEALTLRSQTRYGEVANRYVVSVPRAPDTSDPDPANWTVSTGSPQRNATSRYIGNITTANATVFTGGIEHSLVLGGEYSDEKITNLRYAFPDFVELDNGTQLPVSGGFTLNLFNPNPVLGYSIPAIVDTSVAPAVTRVESWSIFAIDTIKLTPQLELLLGGRYDTFAITSSGESRGTPYSASADVGFFNTQASLLYKPVEAVSLYASFSTSSNPSGEQLDSSSPTYGGLVGVQDLEPERNKAYEIGAKWEMADGHLLLTAAAFRIDKTNARENAGGGVYVNVGAQRSDGFEVGLNGNVTSRWSVFGGYTYLDATIRNSLDPTIDGARFANVPRHSFSLLSSYAITDRFTLGAQAFYRSRIYGGTAQAGTASVPGYWKFDAVARYKVSDRIELRANVLNIFDKRYYDAIYRSGTPFSYVAPGRSATLSVTVSM
ncbi:MAG: TonB-dependent siderophore receptor [Sphingomonadales bacterium]|nr:TonB-dependent siderophore receptor [Sphingomonadales bacterium]MBD3774680.1 TonB-dependent siderophore receptor [Paracoccaceae bacterium]